MYLVPLITTLSCLEFLKILLVRGLLNQFENIFLPVMPTITENTEPRDWYSFDFI